ncbi:MULTISPECIES: Sir2 family NAD-dependent protein deacetylase [unclassified Herbaspirillum]|uniref:SIR2 family NAD-dependent protein deacylase n=1 Tax=unclassified Herbaspirillum TaxID=2624150 RepID=UPI00114EED5B|nr:MULTISPECIES: Sir2 family NAD-dependent protein deacetylase [unclassified Herbaspirillum]MBB5393920.1 NAD-dependent SIR2 family protein deacetylase [Herbaspirillum sp. SJZ102]TQK00042.1 NAD-dependent SIR2 family protein deacetylase [Herbaspirillum sp. SJZ130]TQK04634.1 NAD-dependent SIR2 family protein deacetylase [Herbaspirillum sp. SJZ106]
MLATPSTLSIDPALLTRVRQWLQEADSLIITAGAGMGVDSGLPDFRGNEGFWNAYPPLAKTGITFTEIANGEAFTEDPVQSWGFYGHRLALYRETVPHAGFALLNELAKTKPQGMFVFTSNVDGQFQKAGVAEEYIVECHGSIHHLQCSDDCTGAIWPADAVTPQVDMAHCRLSSPLPLCLSCGAVARPNILMFNDYRWNERRTDAQYARMRAWMDAAKRPMVIELGAGTAVPSVRRMSENLGAPLIRINPREWLVKGANKVGLPCGALEGLRLLLS